MRHWSEHFDDFLAQRKIAEGLEFWHQHEQEVAHLDPADRQASAVLVRLAQWVDLGYRPLVPLWDLTERFNAGHRSILPVKEFLELRMAEGFAAMEREELDKGIALLDFVLRADQELMDVRLTAICHFWKGRSHRKKGEYEEAWKHVVAGRTLMEQLGQPKLAAVIQIQESWLLFQRGDLKESRNLLELARQQFLNTDDHLSKGNIASAAGRIDQQEGRYAEALGHFEAAVELYGKHDQFHRNLARTLVNLATVKRLIALQLKKRIDERAVAIRPTLSAKSADKGGAPGENPHSRSLRALEWGTRSSVESTTRQGENLMVRYNQLCEEALEELAQAKRIYERHNYHSGIAAVLVSSGYLHLDSGDVVQAAGDGAAAFRRSEEKDDHIHMARARTLQCIAENTKVEEEFGEDADTAAHAGNARTFGDEAVQWAEHTQNRRLIAEAYVARGRVHANEFFAEWEDAQRCADKAAALVADDARDHLWEELLALKTKIRRASSIDETLRAWSEGMLGDKTFQQVTEEFAELVIPKVWLREGKKIARVSQKLAISPKKVRRVLRSVGMMR